MKNKLYYRFPLTYEFHWVGGDESSSFKIVFELILLIIFLFIYLLLASKMTVINVRALT